MKNFETLATGLIALIGIPLIAYLSWRIIHGMNELSCISNSYSFGCRSYTVDLLGLLIALEIIVVIYLWNKLRGR